MPYMLKVDQPHLGDVGEIYIHGLGTFRNGEYEITDEAAEHYSRMHSRDEGYYDGDPESSTFGAYIAKHALGPSLEEAAEGMYGVTLTKVGAKGQVPKRPVEDPPSGTRADTGGDR